MNDTRRNSDMPVGRDVGASLMLAIGFVVMIGVISAGLISLATSSLNNRAALEQVRNREYAADGAIEVTVAQLRSSSVSTLATCTAANGFVIDTSNSLTMRVDWRNACSLVQTIDGAVVAQRNVVLSACENTGASCIDSAVVIRAQVNFERSATGGVARTYVQSWSVNR